MKKTITIIFTISLIGFLAISSCQKKQDNIVADMEQTEFPDQEGWNSTVTSSKNGIVGAIIEYGHMQRFMKRKVVEFDSGVAVDFYDEQGVHTSKLTSNKGKLDEATNNIEAIGNVHVVSDTGISLKTERLKWDNSIEKIISKEFVTIVTAEKDTFYGNGFVSDQNLENWHITGFSGKASKGLDLDFQFKKKKQQTDSASTKIAADTLKDTTTVIK